MLALTIICEALPTGLILRFMGGDVILSSYFDVDGWGVVGALPTATLTCLMTALALIELIIQNKMLRGFIGVLSILASLFALWTMIASFTLVSVCVFLLLLAHTLAVILGDNCKAFQ